MNKYGQAIVAIAILWIASLAIPGVAVAQCGECGWFHDDESGDDIHFFTGGGCDGGAYNGSGHGADDCHSEGWTWTCGEAHDLCFAPVADVDLESLTLPAASSGDLQQVRELLAEGTAAWNETSGVLLFHSVCEQGTIVAAVVPSSEIRGALALAKPSDLDH